MRKFAEYLQLIETEVKGAIKVEVGLGGPGGLDAGGLVIMVRRYPGYNEILGFSKYFPMQELIAIKDDSILIHSFIKQANDHFGAHLEAQKKGQ